MQSTTERFARVFRLGTLDQVDFGSLSPLKGNAEWSAVALVNPSEETNYAPIISKRRTFSVGLNVFTLWLKGGAISVECDASGGQSRLKPPLGKWSYVGLSSTAEKAHIYLGVDGDVQIEERKGLPTGADGKDLPLIIGKLGGNFPGAIAEIYLYSKALSDSAMREICAGKRSPDQEAALAFSWSARDGAETDAVSGRAPTIFGTELINITGEAILAKMSESLPLPAEAGIAPGAVATLQEGYKRSLAENRQSSSDKKKRESGWKKFTKKFRP